VLPAADQEAAREDFAYRLDFLWLTACRENRTNPAYAAYYLVNQNPWLFKGRYAADLTEERYRDLREQALGSRRSPFADRRWVDNATSVARHQEHYEAMWGDELAT